MLIHQKWKDFCSPSYFSIFHYQSAEYNEGSLFYHEAMQYLVQKSLKKVGAMQQIIYQNDMQNMKMKENSITFLKWG